MISHFPNRSYTELISSMDLNINACIREAERLLWETQSVTCFSCKRPLEIETRGKRKYCAACGCYLPEIIYGDHFRDATKMLPLGG